MVEESRRFATATTPYGTGPLLDIKLFYILGTGIAGHVTVYILEHMVQD